MTIFDTFIRGLQRRISLVVCNWQAIVFLNGVILIIFLSKGNINNMRFLKSTRSRLGKYIF